MVCYLSSLARVAMVMGVFFFNILGSSVQRFFFSFFSIFISPFVCFPVRRMQPLFSLELRCWAVCLWAVSSSVRQLGAAGWVGSASSGEESSFFPLAQTLQSRPHFPFSNSSYYLFFPSQFLCITVCPPFLPTLLYASASPRSTHLTPDFSHWNRLYGCPCVCEIHRSARTAV